MTREITLANGQIALVDDVDYKRLRKFRWHASPQKHTTYAVFCLPTRGGKRTIYMQNFLLRPAPGYVVDHVNHDGLDCRRSNLRIATEAQNGFNRRSAGNRTGFRGVIKRGSKFWAAVAAYGQRYRAGPFDDAVGAANAYDALARKVHGEFAVLNFPEAVAA